MAGMFGTGKSCLFVVKTWLSMEALRLPLDCFLLTGNFLLLLFSCLLAPAAAVGCNIFGGSRSLFSVFWKSTSSYWIGILLYLCVLYIDSRLSTWERSDFLENPASFSADELSQPVVFLWGSNGPRCTSSFVAGVALSCLTMMAEDFLAFYPCFKFFSSVRSLD